MNVEIERNIFVHPNALCECAAIGDGTRIWAFAHIMQGAHIGCDCNIGDHAFIESGAVIGNRVTVKNQVLIWDGVVIEDDVFLGPRMAFTNDRFPRSPRMDGIPGVAKRYAVKECWCSGTKVRQGASVGAGAVIAPGVVIGRYSMIGMGAIVCGDVADYALVVGNPARQVGWVCACGSVIGRTHPLNDKGRMDCSCGLSYRAIDGGQVEKVL